jgi:hypothetical protein
MGRKLTRSTPRAPSAVRKIVVGRKNWLSYGTDSHAESAAELAEF